MASNLFAKIRFFILCKLFYKDRLYCFLQSFQEPCRIHTIHLHVVKLKGDGHHRFPQMLTILSPHHHRIAEQFSILVDNDIKFRSRERGRADDHIIFEEGTLTALGNGFRQGQIVAVELQQVASDVDVAGVYAAWPMQ